MSTGAGKARPNFYGDNFMSDIRDINWSTTKEDCETINAIAKRAVNIFKKFGIKTSYIHLKMDLTACHCNGTPLKLKELLDADNFNFMHDVAGIENSINRRTGKIENHFLPRFSKPCNCDQDTICVKCADIPLI
jgi:hypothetical protein